MLKIALNNWMGGSGKDRCADYLVEKHGFKKYSLSEGIYKIAYDAYGIEEESRPERKLLWHIGESLRAYDKLLWINRTLRKINGEGHDRVVITDVRKLLEHSYLGEIGFENVMIYCDPKVAMERIKKRDGKVDEEELMNNHLENQLRPLQNHMKNIDNSDDFEETTKELDAFVRFLEDQEKGKVVSGKFH
ncbi:AAA family ATPase [Bacillus atrophaeus]|uniref:AAA family ATPase n=1 Tax=Bacillus atrophaeus TaxID=1452 RepID=UPI002281661C|nr:AAA family ATPase [Bacillus atrophaeus]MCY7947982.1 AAA family ATPase [Bacillus atrophaeus]MCY8098072.1 AAA family ATPase [Bacillus atrophaeus]MCY9169996.1 AAA family ATPase [Bacillus atrophaeus]MEC0740722.1 AAA family ATPase [Bacillus atrophaeus]MEC0747015.1 AAA family ATPase [Bacillus atrophaeus]